MANLHLMRWYMWIAYVGVGLIFLAFMHPLPEINNLGVLIFALGVFFSGLAESTCHTTQTTLYPAGVLPGGFGPAQGTRPIRRWCVTALVLYTIGGSFLSLGVAMLWPELERHFESQRVNG